MSWIDKFFENNSWLNIARLNSNDELIDSSGAVISGVASYTWAQFIDAGFDLTVARYVRVTDKHSTRDATATPGSLWFIDPTATTNYKRQLVSDPIYTTESALLTASSYPGLKIFRAEWGSYGGDHYSDGANWILETQTITHRDTTRSTMHVVPAATFVGTYTISNSSGSTKIKSAGAGAHGLTNAVVVTPGASYIYISGGTNWTVGFHKITDVSTAADEIILETAYSAGFGSPTIVLAGSGTDVVIETLTIPKLTANNSIHLDLTTLHPNTANNKNLKIKLGGTTMFTPTYASTGLSNRPIYSIFNRGSVSSQVAGVGNLSNSGLGISSAACATASIDTSAGTTLTISYALAAANEVCGIERYEVIIR